MAVIVGKIATGFLNLATAIGTAKVALSSFSKFSKTTVIGALVGLTTSVLMLKDSFAETKEPSNELEKLLERQKLAQLNLEKATILNIETKKRELALVNAQIEKFKESATALAMEEAGKQRQIITSKDYQDNLSKELQKIEELKKQRQKLADAEFQIRGVDVEAISGGINFDDKLNQIRQQFDTEFELQKEMNEKNIQRIQGHDELQVELARIQADKLLQIAHETAEKEKAIRKQVFDENFQLIKSGKASEINLEKMSGKDKTDLAKKVGREALDQLAQSNRKAFQLNKAFRLGEAIMDTAGAVAKVLPNIPLAIAIGALGAIQIASISQQKYQGRRLGGRMNQGEPYMVGEAGAELVIPDRPSNVVPNNKLGGMSQPVTVNFNISTVDARGFNELLVNSRGTIVNLINSAVNEKGRMAIV